MKILKDGFSAIVSFRFNGGKYLPALALLLVTLPAWAAHSDSFSWQIHVPTTIGNAQIKPGNYVFKAEEGRFELQIIQGNEVIATVPCHWTHLRDKASASEVKTLDNQIIQLQFAGRREAIQFDQ